MLVLQRYGTRENFMQVFSPSLQLSVASHEDRAVMGTAPELYLLKFAYGENAPVAWLMPQIWDLCEFTNNRGKLDGAVGEYLAGMIVHEYGYLKVSELLLFFYRFKTGAYGRFYGNIDPMIIMAGLERFLGERAVIINRVESAQHDQERNERTASKMSPQEWCRSLGLPECSTAYEVMLMRDRIINYIEAVVASIGTLYRIIIIIAS